MVTLMECVSYNLNKMKIKEKTVEREGTKRASELLHPLAVSTSHHFSPTVSRTPSLRSDNGSC